jgi:chromosome segregation protein
MYLSRLEIQGFKSFAQRVSLRFDSGISAIVGPNGCGKTNIVDAIRWVLGEQRYSALRSEKMEDVIFNGTKTRKALGMAEASLVIENTKGILPSEYTQVTIGRRIYRSGESEYLLNGVTCRLKDILDLFMDTGMGADAYSVIELKMIEVILSDRTDERRRLFEEAAGVTKYKHRRKAAYRKLEAVQADLLRVNDIVAEVNKAVNSLERQAKRAEQFNDVKQRHRAMEIELLEREYAQVQMRLEPLVARQKELHAERSVTDEDLGNVEGRLEELRTALLTAEKELAEAQRDVSLQREAIHGIEEKSLVAAEQVKAARALIARLEREDGDLQQERARQEQLREQYAEDLTALALREAGGVEESVQRNQEMQDSVQQVELMKAQVRAMNGQLLEAVQRTAERQAEHDRRKVRLDVLMGDVKEVEEDIAAYAADVVRHDQTFAELTEDDRRLRRAFAEAEVRFYDAEQKRKELRDRIDELQRRETEFRAEMERLAGRIEFLQGLIESREGVPESVRFLGTIDRWASRKALTVADAVHADEEYRIAIEAALGDTGGLVIVDRADDAEQGVVLLREQGKGKATFVCLDRLPLITRRYQVPELPGVRGWALDMARFDPELEPLFSFLLDRVLVVESAEVAREVARHYAGIRCVTLEGEIAASVGLIRGGSRRIEEGGAIGKQHQIEELRARVQEIESRASSIAAERGAVTAAYDAIDLKQHQDAVKAIEKEMHAIEMRIAQVAFEKKRAEESRAASGEQSTRLAAETASVHEELAAGEPRLAAVRAEQEDVERRLQEARTGLDECERESARRAKVVQDLGVELMQIRNSVQTITGNQARAADALTTIAETLEKHGHDAEQTRLVITTVEAGIGENRRALESLHQELTLREHRKTDIEETATRQRNEIHAAELRIRDQRRIHDDALRVLHDTDLKIADLRSRADHLMNRAKEEFEITLELKTYPDTEFVDFAQLREEIQGMKDKIKSLGNINFAAFEEYTAEKQRMDFLTGQRQDLIEAEKTLLATIEEINTTAQRKFLETFEQIRNNFIETFKSLFDPGDECDLKLEENVDPLEARIEIVAKPRGKRPTSIDLLSGGEKTLTATALLFAIYLVKPSPFCILDEVDAPLDDANIDRFTRIIRKFSANTQFIVVTHNKRTMEAANAMYGVTMEEEGVSKLVTVRFNQDSQIASATVATA